VTEFARSETAELGALKIEKPQSPGRGALSARSGGMEPFYRITDVARLLHVSRATVYNLLRGETIVDLSEKGRKGIKLVPESTLNQIIARCKKRFL
jgi:hypothetical protein